jgi:alcohol dehydrogenase (cytochrome c)
MAGPGKKKFSIFVVIVLVLSIPAEVKASNLSSYNWSYPNADPHGTDFSPQTEITASNVASLSVRWLFTIPTSTQLPGLNITGQGAIAPPLVVDGVVYLLTNYLAVYAINSLDGSVIWSEQLTLNRTGQPLGLLVGHMHGMVYYRGALWVELPDCSVVSLDSATGSELLRITNICQGIPGNSGLYTTHGAAPVFYGDTIIVGSSVSEGTDSGRGFVSAYNITDGALLWRWFVTPPAGGESDWDRLSCPPPCTGNVAPYPGDWGDMGYNGSNTLAGAGASWGQYAVDESRGVVYLSTSQPSPDWNATNRPGPNLYSDSIVALNATTGAMIWFFQTTPHDMYDFDCGWNVVLGNLTVHGGNVSAVFKACKNGFVYALNATNGSLLWYFDPPSVMRMNTENSLYVETGSYNSTLSWPEYPSNESYVQCPGANGAIEADIAFAYGKIFVATHNFCYVVGTGPVDNYGGNVTGAGFVTPLPQEANTTIYALDASTGKVDWSFFIPGVPFRGWLTASGGLVYVSSLDGDIYALSEVDGRLVGKIHVGPSLYEGPVLGSDAAGRVIFLQLVSASDYRLSNSGTPGVLVAYEVSQKTVLTTQVLLYLLAASFAALVLSWLYFRRHRSVSVAAKKS